jgi:hypothetical protein
MNYGDGVYGSQFVGAMYAAAFFEDDMEEVVRAGLAAIPEGSQYHECISDVLRWYRDAPDDWQKTWRKIDAKYQKDPDYRRFSCSGAEADFNIDAKINGAYIVMGLLYGKGDPDKTIVISMRCGADSDCNPSNAGGILFTSMGLEHVPDRFKSALDREEEFSYTAYTFPRLLTVCEKLVRQAVVRSGGHVENSDDGREILVIPVRPAAPSTLAQCHEPGPTAGSRFSDAEMESIEYPTMQGAVDHVLPGWTIRDWGLDWSPGYYAELCGKEDVLVTLNERDKPFCVMSRTLDIPASGRPALRLAVGRVPWFFCSVAVRVDGEELKRTRLDGETAPDGWLSLDVDLSEFRGKSVDAELLGTGPVFWHRVELTNRAGK